MLGLGMVKKAVVLAAVVAVLYVAFETVRLAPTTYDAGGLALMLFFVALGATLVIGIIVVTVRIVRSLPTRQ